MRYNLPILISETPPVLEAPRGVSHSQEGVSFMAAERYSNSAPNESQSTYVYFIAAGASAIKIGISNDPDTRLRDLQAGNHLRLRLLYTIECATRADAFELEAAFHRWYGEAVIHLEWFKLSPQKIADDIQLLSSLSRVMLGIEQRISPRELEWLEKRAEQRFQRTPDGQRRVIDYLTQHPEDAAMPSRQLAARIAQVTGVTVGHDTANKGRNAWREQTVTGDTGHA